MSAPSHRLHLASRNPKKIAEIERILGTQVHLDLRVKIAKEWQGDPKQLGRFGF